MTSHFVNICMFSVFTCPTYTCVPMLVFLKVSESTISVSYISAQGSLCWNWLTFPGAGSVNQLQLLAAFPNWRNKLLQVHGNSPAAAKAECSPQRALAAPPGCGAELQLPSSLPSAPVGSTSTCTALENPYFTKNRAGCAWRGVLIII